MSCYEFVLFVLFDFKSGHTLLFPLGKFIKCYDQVTIMEREISFPMMCAYANNNVKCYDMSIDFVENVEERISEEYKDSLEVEEVW